MSVRTKIQNETKRKGPPRNLGRGELAFNEVDGLLYIGTGSENRGQARKKVIINDSAKTSEVSTKEIESYLRSNGYATQDYVDDKYSQERYSIPDPNEDITPTSTGENKEWVFNTNQHEWHVTHNLGYYPDVTTLANITGDDYEEFDAYVKHNSVNDLTVICMGTTTGKLLLR